MAATLYASSTLFRLRSLHSRPNRGGFFLGNPDSALGLQRGSPRNPRCKAICCAYGTPELFTSLEQSHEVPRLAHALQSNYSQCLLLGDLDPATAKLLIGLTGPILSTFGFLFIARIVMSWYPKLPVGKFPYVIAYAPTEPILSFTRRLIPPVGGVDVTPVVWFGLLSFLNEILVGPQGLLVLLSQQI